MATWIALFRGINVGGNNLLPMKSLAALLEKLGHAEVQTYIQSGNAIFRSPKKDAVEIGKQIGAAIAKKHGFEPRVFVLNAKELTKVIAGNPFPHAAAEHKALHCFFLAAAAKQPDIETLNELKAATETFALTKQAFYLHAPAGIGKSKLAGRVEKLLGVATTARNWQTVTRVMAIASVIERSGE